VLLLSTCASVLPCLEGSASSVDLPHRVTVADGDKVNVSDPQQGEAVRLRLFGIDAPDEGQPYRQEAKDFLDNFVKDKTIAVRFRRGFFHESDGRSVASVVLPDGSTASRAIVMAGLAWVYEEDFQTDPDDEVDGKNELKALEAEARDAKRGLWADAHPVPPWLYRRLQSGAYP
jgi:micrococcal nuclease